MSTDSSSAGPGPRHEEHRLSGEELLQKVRELVHEGRVRHLILKDEQGRTLIEVPLALGVVGALIAPVWAALGAVAALVSHVTLVVVREPDEPGDGSQSSE
jgi:hypothetical protein